jgi:hypothetical protein
MNAIATNGGTQIYCNDWASGQPVSGPNRVYGKGKQLELPEA